MVAAVVMAWALARTLTGLHQRVAEQAVTDPLTGLWNRRYMSETLDREVARARRFGHPISLIILDVDDFKEINDRRGHMQGDMVLESVADVVREATRSIDVAARYGGDELALILVETEREGAVILGERLGERMRATQVPLREGGSMGATISIGVATIPDSAEDVRFPGRRRRHGAAQSEGSGKEPDSHRADYPSWGGRRGGRSHAGGRQRSSQRRPRGKRP